jgi:hypothetical protein
MIQVGHFDLLQQAANEIDRGFSIWNLGGQAEPQQ